MKTTLYKSALIAMFAMTTAVLYSQDDMQSMSATLKNAQVWIGKWQGSFTMTMEDKNYNPSGTWTFTPVAGGSGMMLSEEVSDPALGQMSSVDLMGYDPFDKKIHVYTVDNKGTCHDHICEWKSPDHFYLEHNSRRDGKAYMEKIDLGMNGSDAFYTTFTGTMDGKVVSSGKGNFTRMK